MPTPQPGGYVAPSGLDKSGGIHLARGFTPGFHISPLQGSGSQGLKARHGIAQGEALGSRPPSIKIPRPEGAAQTTHAAVMSPLQGSTNWGTSPNPGLHPGL